MTQIEFVEDMARIDADVLAKAFRISTDDLKRGMRDGTITSRFEKGEDEDAGKVRLTFFSAHRRVRVTADEQGHILMCSAADFTKPASRASPTDSQTGGTAAGGAGKTGKMAPDSPGADPTHEAESARQARLDALLDAALQGTFPASDPIAISFDVPDPAGPPGKKSDDG